MVLEVAPPLDAINKASAWEKLIRHGHPSKSGAAALAAKLGAKAEIARELCYRLYTVCERKKRAAEALSYNLLVQSWRREGGTVGPAQAKMFDGTEERSNT